MPATDTVNVAIQAKTLYGLPLWVAEQKGFFTEEGIAVKVEVILDSELIKERLRSGGLHLSVASSEIVLIEAFETGALRIVGGNACKPPLCLIAQPRIKTLADLRGATIGVLSLQEGSSKLIRTFAASVGLKPEDYTLSPVGGATVRWRLLKEGKIDAGLQPFGLSDEAEAAGFNNLGWAGVHEPDWQFTAIFTNGDWARKNPQTVVRFLRAVLRGQQYIGSDPDDATRIAAEELCTPVPPTARAIAACIHHDIFEPRLGWSEAGLERIFAHLQTDGSIPKDRKFEIATFVETEYLRAMQNSMTDSSR